MFMKVEESVDVEFRLLEQVKIVSMVECSSCLLALQHVR